MKAGAMDCAQYPWTEEALRPLYRKALNISGTNIVLDTSALHRRRRAVTLLLAGFFAFTGFAGGFYYGFKKFTPRPARPHSFMLPYAHPTGIVDRGDTVLISDWYSQGLYEHNAATMGIKHVTSLQETTPVAMAASNDALWLAGAGGVIEKRLLDARYTPVAKTAAFKPAPDSVCFDGLYFWTADSRSGEIVKRMPGDALAPLKTFKYPGKKLSSLTCDRRFLWAADPGLKALVKLSLEDPETIISSTELPEFSSKTLKITAMSSANGRIWLAGEDGERGMAFFTNEPK
jgi:hypothetical protein